MRIGIDGRALQGFIEGSRAGVGRYVFELCRELDRQLPEAQFFVYTSAPIEMPVISNRWILRLDESALASYLKPVFWLKYRCGQLCKADHLDVFWGAATFLPRLPKSVKTVMTVYDLNFKMVPDTMSRTHRWAYSLFFKRDLQRSSMVLSISKGTSDRLLGQFRRPADAIVYPAVGPEFRPQSPALVQTVLSHYGIDTAYLLAVATWEPRKNLGVLIQTFLQMKREGLLREHRLVLVGGRGWKDQRLRALAKEHDSVSALGYVPDSHLPQLYSGADLFLYPSIYEGFGMPVLEARACGTTVITTNIPELREAGGEHSIYVTPLEPNIKSAILQCLPCATTAKKIQPKNLPTWGKAAEILAKVIKQ